MIMTSTINIKDKNRATLKGSAIAIGNFDGFHLGHQKIIRNLKEIAAGNDLTSMIITFTPNPKLYFNREPFLVNTDLQKKRILESAGADKVYIIDFEQVVNMTDEEFLIEVLIERFRMKHIVMGENFRFGRGREGDITFLKEASQRYGFSFSVVSPVHLGDTRISSTLIRSLLSEGEIETANRMLGREYFIEGAVVEGDRRGRGLGYPTININTGNTLLPEGVFQAVVELDCREYRAISYIGTRPTFDGKEKKVEAHLFDFNSRAYDKPVRVNFHRKIRGDMTFNSQDKLIEQIKKDIENLNFVDKGMIF